MILRPRVLFGRFSYGGADFIVNDLVGGSSITKNGYHRAVQVGDKVYDNYFKKGVEASKYFDSIQA